MKNFKNKSIILAVPNHFGLPKVFRKNLEYLGFEVFVVEHDDLKIKLTAEESLIHIYNKTFNNNKTFKAKLSTEKKEIPQLLFLEKIEYVDYALVIRPDLFSKNVLQKIKDKSDFSVAYQWDGMRRFPLAQDTVTYFDRFFVFDEGDTKRYHGTKHIHNFYFDYLPGDNQIKQDIFFVGTFMKDRIRELINLCDIFKKLELKTNINVIYNRSGHIEKYTHTNINFEKTGMSFEENMINAKMSNIILDFQNSFHNGISFRTFEAIGYEKKLITNNPLVKNYDFYNPNNIFVFTNENIHELGDFLAKDCVKLSNKIIEEYSFTNWIQKVLTFN